MLVEITAVARASSRATKLAVIEVPSTRGLHPSGVEDAPEASREAGFIGFTSPPTPAVLLAV